MEISRKIKDLLAKGETEKALDMLVEGARELGGPVEQQALLLSGQYKQWKRDRTLGIEHSSGELRRIELGIMQILELKDTTVRKTYAPIASSRPTSTTDSPVKKFLPILLGLLVLTFAALYFTKTTPETPAEPPETTTNTSPTIDNDATLPTTEEVDNAEPPVVEEKPVLPVKEFTYKTVDLAGKTWMAENLNEPTNGSVCFNNDDYNCSQAGRLYTSSSARKACAALGDGWRLPTDSDWKDLIRMYGGAYGDTSDGTSAYEKLTQGGPTNFNASFGGKQIYIGDPPKFYFYDFGDHGYYWVDKAAEDPSQSKMMTFRSNDKRVLYETISNTDYIACRCVKD